MEIDRITTATLKSVTLQTIIRNAERKEERRKDASRKKAPAGETDMPDGVEPASEKA
jgi:hypothetical protein